MLQFDIQVNIGYGIIENENRVTGKSKIHKNAKMGIFWQQEDTYAVVERPSNLVFNVSNALLYSTICRHSKTGIIDI
jgi:hypothetical protein